MKKALIIVIILNILRLAFMPFIGLTPQESYFAYYADHLSLSYYDHPPMVGYTIWLFMKLFGHNMFAVKFASFVITLLAQLAFFALSSRVLRSDRKYLAWVIFCSSMMVTSLSLQNCPDVVLTLFWTLSLWALYRAIFDGENRFWIYAGIFMGLAFDSKYPAIGLPAGLLVFLLFSGRYRHMLTKPWPYLSILIMVALALPVLIWNAQNGFVSFRINSVLRSGPFDDMTPQNIFQFVLSQIIILMPVLFVGLWQLFGKYMWRIVTKPNQTNPEVWFLFCFFMPIFLGVYLVSLFGEVKYNWLIPTYISGIVLMARFMELRWQRWNWYCSIAVHVVAIYVIWIAPHSDYVRYDLGLDSVRLASSIDSIHKSNPNTFVFATDGYKTASKISFYNRNDTVYGPQIIGQTPYHFGYIGLDTDKLKGRDGIWVKPKMSSSNSQFPLINNYFADVRWMYCVKVPGEPEAYNVFYCKGYKGVSEK
ncbi:MAG: glycosyltransferase family 39 protein [Salinivirgaceae bacterium]|nr:glycosyltransferase family 39 protein [Salinivirgaceae bacterium]